MLKNSWPCSHRGQLLIIHNQITKTRNLFDSLGMLWLILSDSKELIECYVCKSFNYIIIHKYPNLSVDFSFIMEPWKALSIFVNYGLKLCYIRPWGRVKFITGPFNGKIESFTLQLFTHWLTWLLLLHLALWPPLWLLFQQNVPHGKIFIR